MFTPGLIELLKPPVLNDNFFIFLYHFKELLDLFSMTKAAITPGTQPQNVKINTIKKEPQPLSTIERGGKIIDNKTLKKDIWKRDNSKIQILIVQ